MLMLVSFSVLTKRPGLQMQCAVNFFILDLRRVLAQSAGTKTHTQIQILHHFEKMGRNVRLLEIDWPAFHEAVDKAFE